jgi:hypothetical protein
LVIVTYPYRIVITNNNSIKSDLNTAGLFVNNVSTPSPKSSNTLDLGQEAGSLKKGISHSTNLISNTNASAVDLKTYDNKLNTNYNLFDYSIFYKIFTHRSPNQQILSSDRNIRSYDILNPNKVNYNIGSNSNNLNADLSNSDTVYTSLNTVMPQQHMPSSSLGTKLTNLSYDKFTSNGMNNSLMSAKEELAPNFIFTPY